MKKQVTAIMLLLLVLLSVNAFANKTSVTIDGPPSAAMGSEITLKINVKHDGNNFFHYTKEVVVVKANGQEIARWDFSATNRPENEVFSREVKYTLNETTEFLAEGFCNIHGSDGPATLTVNAQ